MTNLDKEDREYFDKHFKTLYDRHNSTDKQVTTNTTDIGWLKRSHAAVVGIASTLIISLILWAVFGGG
jgi:hypothetical protein